MLLLQNLLICKILDFIFVKVKVICLFGNSRFGVYFTKSFILCFKLLMQNFTKHVLYHLVCINQTFVGWVFSKLICWVGFFLSFFVLVGCFFSKHLNQNLRCSFKIHLTSTRLVCFDFHACFMLNLNMVLKILIKTKVDIWICHLHLKSTLRYLMG